MVVAVLVAGWFLLLPNEYVALGKSAMAFAAIVANLFISGEIPAAILPMERKCLYSIFGLWQLKSSFT